MFVQVPLVAVSCVSWVALAPPVIVGSTVLLGRVAFACTTALTAELADTEPAPLVAVTVTLTV